MKNKGFTLIELLAVITLLVAVMLLIYPAVLEKVQEKEDDILDKKKELIYSATYDYLYENKATYPIRSGNVYCVNMGYLRSLDKLPVDEYEGILKDNDITKNYIVVKIGNDDNAYSISTNATNVCETNNIIGG